MPTGHGYALIFDTRITLFDQSFDSLELTMDVACHPDLSVNAAVEVACWCAKDHNIHQVRQSHWPVADTEELVAAFAAGITMLTSALDSGPFDPSLMATRCRTARRPTRNAVTA
ncbi:MAG TPA: hypothetical protein VGD29_01500, partial [Actinoplanes sp.]